MTPGSPPPVRTVSLRDWLDLARRTGVPHVPAAKICDIRVRDILEYDTGSAAVQGRLKTAWARMAAARRPRTMFRWDCCASEDLRHLMAQGREAPDELRDLQTLTIDMRIYELAGEYPASTMPIRARPWIRDRMLVVDRYPVEYRAFIHAGNVAGISSYHPQRPLRRRKNGGRRSAAPRGRPPALRRSPPLLLPGRRIHGVALTARSDT